MEHLMQYLIMGTSVQHYVHTVTIFSKHGLLWSSFIDKYGDFFIYTTESITRPQLDAAWKEIELHDDLELIPRNDEFCLTVEQVLSAYETNTKGDFRSI